MDRNRSHYPPKFCVTYDCQCLTAFFARRNQYKKKGGRSIANIADLHAFELSGAGSILILLFDELTKLATLS